MRLTAALISVQSAPYLASILAVLAAAWGRRHASSPPPAPARPPVYCLSQRVRVALQAAARARR